MKKFVIMIPLLICLTLGVNSNVYAQEIDSEGNYVFTPEDFRLFWNEYRYLQEENKSKDKEINRLKKDRVAVEGLILKHERRNLELELKLEDYYTPYEVTLYVTIGVVVSGVLVYVLSSAL